MWEFAPFGQVELDAFGKKENYINFNQLRIPWTEEPDRLQFRRVAKSRSWLSNEHFHFKKLTWLLWGFSRAGTRRAQSLSGTVNSKTLTQSKAGLALFPGLLGFWDPQISVPRLQLTNPFCRSAEILDPDTLAEGDTSLSTFWNSYHELQSSYSHLNITSLNYILNI